MPGLFCTLFPPPRSALVVATELAKAFKTDINSLPLSLDISWFEQKAVSVLLTLLSLGVKNIRRGREVVAHSRGGQREGKGGGRRRFARFIGQ